LRAIFLLCSVGINSLSLNHCRDERENDEAFSFAVFLILLIISFGPGYIPKLFVSILLSEQGIKFCESCLEHLISAIITLLSTCNDLCCPIFNFFFFSFFPLFLYLQEMSFARNS
jgi:hypothetical protein